VGENSVVCHLTDRYANVFNSLQGDAHYPIDIALRAYQKCGITPQPVAMRGGYDGAVLSQKGLPCPNIFTGAHNFHSIYEYLPVRSLRAASDVVVAVIEETFAEFAQGRAQS
jgi:tripeptide aminopeptidase